MPCSERAWWTDAGGRAAVSAGFITQTGGNGAVQRYLLWNTQKKMNRSLEWRAMEWSRIEPGEHEVADPEGS